MKKVLILLLMLLIAAGIILWRASCPTEHTWSLTSGCEPLSMAEPMDEPLIQNSGAPAEDPALEAGRRLSNGKCEGKEKPLLTTSPMRDEDFSMITPYGLMIGGHVTPIDHQYFEPTNFQSEKDAYPVYAMADAKLVDIGTRTSQFGSDEYRLVFSMSCKLFYYYDLVTVMDENILSEFNQKGFVEVAAGEEIGRIGGQTLDFAVWDMDQELDGFVVPEHYSGETWKIHTVDPLEYYTPGLKEKLLAKYLRTAEPRSGKIDHDIDGTLQGNWFREDAVGYTAYRGPGNYWLTHASFSPDHIDPNGFVISLGDFDGEAKQFGAAGNTPQPKDVTPETGLVKYNLTQIQYKTPNGNYWNRSSLDIPLTFEAGGEKQGCVLVQLLEDRKLQLESFSKTSCDTISGFTANAKIYER